jgi:hypothetical protein
MKARLNMKWLIIGFALVILGRELNVNYCQYRQFAGLFTDNYVVGNYVFSFGDFLQILGFVSVTWFCNQFLLK